MITRIKKRGGEVVDFHTDNISSAISRAFDSVEGGIDDTNLAAITGRIVEELGGSPGDMTSVEQVQDIIERRLMADGYYEVAKAYIVYRYKHAEQRQRLDPELGETIKVTKRDGSIEVFNKAKLRACLKAIVGSHTAGLDFEAIITQSRQDLYDGATTEQVFDALIMATRAMIERDPAYSQAAARLLTHQIYLQAVGEEPFRPAKADKQLRQIFIRNTKLAVALEKLDPKMLDFDLELLSRALTFSRDQAFNYLGIQTLEDRYFLRNDQTRRILETPQAFWMRVAMGLALGEKAEARNEAAIKFYEVMSTLRFVPSTPTLFHAGTTHPQLSSCYLTTVEDSLTHIFKSIGDNAQLSKWSGGLGNDWTNIRGTGAAIKATGVDSQGVIPFLKIANDTTAAINRSGRRRGATCAYLEVWHYDIESFAELRKNTGDERRRTHDMDTAAWIPDLFMKRVREGAAWTLFSPDETPDLHDLYGAKFEQAYEAYEAKARAGKIRLHKTVDAKTLWQKLLSMLYETGHPWITFKDASNIRSPQDHVGVVHSSNLCTEITLNTSASETAVCNLGSVNLAVHTSQGKLDEKLIEQTVATAMRMLDNVIDINFYPTPEARTSNLKHRPVGLGIMGFADALYQQDIQFASTEAVEFADSSMELIAYHAIATSSQLAAERGSYPSFQGSKWQRGLLPIDTLDLLEKERGVKIPVNRNTTLDWDKLRQTVKTQGMRNSNTMAIAPTATIANIAGCVPAIEPIYKNLYVKANQGGDFVVVNNYLVEDLKKLGLWDDEMLKKIKFRDGSLAQITQIPEKLRHKYLETFEIAPKWLLESAAVRSKWIDQSQSLNIFYSGTSGKEISDIYLRVWELGLKTTYYLRTLAASQVEKSTVNTSEFGATHQRTTTLAQEPQNSSSQLSPESELVPALVMAPLGDNVKLCRVEDPDCEACQ